MSGGIGQRKKGGKVMKLKLVKQGEFLGTKCDFYVDEEDNIYMSRTQIGYALQYKQPQHAILMVHQRHKERLDKFSVEVRGSQFETPIYKNKNADKIFMYSERGIYEICRWSNQKMADDFHDWVSDVIISIRKNGYYIASEKDKKWLGIRQETKVVRNQETDMIQKFVAYAKEQGSTHADTYYQNFTKLVNKRCGIKSGGRDSADQRTLLRVKSLETLIEMRLETLMSNGVPYKEAYADIKNMIESI